MRYFTKEWYELGYGLDYTSDFVEIEDKEYTNEEIEELYKEAEKEFVEEERKTYNEPPIKFQDLVDFSSLELTDILITDLDEDGNHINERHPESLEELEKYQELENKRMEEEFANREEFDEEEAKDIFKNYFEANLEASRYFLPEYVTEEVDERIVALGYMPKSTYEKLEAEEKLNEEEYERVFNESIGIMEKEYDKISVEIQDPFYIHDGIISNLEEDNNNIKMQLLGYDLDDEYKNYDITFKNAKFLELEDVSFGEGEEEVVFLYHEMYAVDGGYELHILAGQYPELKYVTIFFEDIEVKNF